MTIENEFFCCCFSDCYIVFCIPGQGSKSYTFRYLLQPEKNTNNSVDSNDVCSTASPILGQSVSDVDSSEEETVKRPRRLANKNFLSDALKSDASSDDESMSDLKTAGDTTSDEKSSGEESDAERDSIHISSHQYQVGNQ